MPAKCFVPGCNNNYLSSEKNVSTFKVPKGQLEIWNRAIPRADRPLTYKDSVCENHFPPDQVISKTVLTFPDGTVYEEVRKRKILVDGAVPTIFEGTCQGSSIPKYLSHRKTVRKNPTKRYGATGNGRSIPAPLPVGSLQKKLHPVVESLKLKLPILLQDALLNAASLPLPVNWKCLEEADSLNFVHSPSGDIFNIDRSVTIKKQEPTSPPEIKLQGKAASLKRNLQTKDDLLKLIKEVHNMRSCPGSSDNQRHRQCTQFIQLQIFSKSSVRCHFCQNDRKNIRKRSARQTKSITKKRKENKQKRDKIHRMKRKILSMQAEIRQLKDAMEAMNEEAVEKVLDSVKEEKHKEVIRTIVMASKCKNSKNRRYSNNWMYECILMRIKSASLYRKMLRDNLLPLPSFRTIQRFIKRLRPQFGFHEPTFKLMAEKAKTLPESERHGTLMFDEMATEENIVFDKVTGRMHGMVEMGSATPPDGDCILGDHALAFAFEPFKGQWFQSIGAFCTKGAAKGPELEKLKNEAIMLLAKHGFFVDVVTSDGGSWNRNMWTINGIDADHVSCVNPADAGLEEEPSEDELSAELPEVDEPSAEDDGADSCSEVAEDSTDEATQTSANHSEGRSTHKSKGRSRRIPRRKKKKARRLWFMSDFPHLVKSMWSRVRTAGQLKTPEGTVKLDHWKILAERDDQKFTHINICHKLNHDHIEPSNWQTMNVQMAFQFFDEDVAIAMEYYRDIEKVPELQDCHATCDFIRKIYRLRKAMNARNAWDSLRYNENNEAYQAITQFLAYLELWKKEVPDPNSRFAWQTELGLKVSLKGTLELCKYLTEELGFEYLMTSRLNQDPLEHFFGKLRAACGDNQHPDPQQFVQVYRLLSVASLIKPPRGSNVTGGEMLGALTSLKDIMEEEDAERRAQFEEELDRILDLGDEQGIVESHFLSEPEDQYLETAPGPAAPEHGYNKATKINPYAFQMFGGYVARKTRRLGIAKKCEECFASLSKRSEQVIETQRIIEQKSRGFLLKPSAELYNFLVKVENVVLSVLSNTQMNRNILLDVVHALEDSGIHSEVGCFLHKREMTKEVLMWYLNTRMFFSAKRHMKTQTAVKKRKKKAKALLKKYKLNAIPVNEEEVDATAAQPSQPKAKKKSRAKKEKQAEDYLDPAIIAEFAVDFQLPVIDPAESQAPNDAAEPDATQDEVPTGAPPKPQTSAEEAGKNFSTAAVTEKKRTNADEEQQNPPKEGKQSRTKKSKVVESKQGESKAMADRVKNTAQARKRKQQSKADEEPPKVPKIDTPSTSRSGRQRKVNNKYTDYKCY